MSSLPQVYNIGPWRPICRIENQCSRLPFFLTKLVPRSLSRTGLRFNWVVEVWESQKWVPRANASTAFSALRGTEISLRRFLERRALSTADILKGNSTSLNVASFSLTLYRWREKCRLTDKRSLNNSWYQYVPPLEFRVGQWIGVSSLSWKYNTSNKPRILCHLLKLLFQLQRHAELSFPPWCHVVSDPKQSTVPYNKFCALLQSGEPIVHHFLMTYFLFMWRGECYICYI